MKKNSIKRLAVLTVVMLATVLPDANAALMTHFKGRYGAIELFDSAKKLSFRVNAPELSQTRNFCQFNDLSIAIAAVELGVLPDFAASVAEYLPHVPGKPTKSLTLRQALRVGTPEVFSGLQSRIPAAQVQTLNAKSALPTKSPMTSAFALLSWFKALDSDVLALKPTTKKALRALLTIKNRDSVKLLAFSSRCAETTGAVGATAGILTRPPAAPVFFAISVDGKTRKDLFFIAPTIRDAALNEFGYWPFESAPENARAALISPTE